MSLDFYFFIFLLRYLLLYIVYCTWPGSRSSGCTINHVTYTGDGSGVTLFTPLSVAKQSMSRKYTQKPTCTHASVQLLSATEGVAFITNFVAEMLKHYQVL